MWKTNKIFFMTSLFPNINSPINGKFNLSRVKALKELGCKVFIISPIGFTPPYNLVLPLPKIKEIKKFYSQQYFSNHNTNYEGIDCYYPKWLWLPKKWFWKYEAEQFIFK